MMRFVLIPPDFRVDVELSNRSTTMRDPATWAPPGTAFDDHGRGDLEPPGGGLVELASWGERASARLFDLLVVDLIAVAGMILILIANGTERGSAVTAALIVLGLAGVAGAIGAQLYNEIWLQGRTGQSWGKRRRGIALVRMGDLAPLGTGRAVGRFALRNLLTLVGAVVPIHLLSWLWPLWDRANRTWEDMAAGSVVVQVEDRAT
jgi:uncharacterized RDD family membrane protein YckC